MYNNEFVPREKDTAEPVWVWMPMEHHNALYQTLDSERYKHKDNRYIYIYIYIYNKKDV